jgi:tetratricopeptide (TPR) repeat protein
LRVNRFVFVLVLLLLQSGLVCARANDAIAAGGDGQAPEGASDDLEITLKDEGTYELHTSTYLTVKQPKKAIADLNNALESEPQNASYYFKRGCAYEELGNFARACEEYTQAVSVNPLAKYFLARAHCYRELNKPVLAAADIRHARKVNPKLPRRIVFKDDVDSRSEQ